MSVPKIEYGDRGQRYEHWCTDKKTGAPRRLGWSNHAGGHFERLVSKHPNFKDHRVIDRLIDRKELTK